MTLELVAWAALGVGVVSALVIVADIVVLGNRQHMPIMDFAFPLTALYLGPVAVWAYFVRGRRMSRKRMEMHRPEPRDSVWQVSLSASHCGAGCVLGDIGGEWIVFSTAWMIGSAAELFPEYLLDLPLAWVFGMVFQYFAIAPLRGQVGHWAPLGDAIKSDTLSVLSFEVGLFGWMGFAQYAISNAPVDSSTHWVIMQIGMVLGLITSWPVNRWLLRHGIKEPMPTM